MILVITQCICVLQSSEKNKSQYIVGRKHAGIISSYVMVEQ